MDDAEGDLTDAVRDAIGPDALISAAMDLHGNVSRRFADRSRPDHLLPDGPARGRLGDHGARRPQPRRAPAPRGDGPPAQGLGPGAGAAARREDLHPPRAGHSRSTRRLADVEALRRRRRRGDLGRLRLGRRAALPGRRRRHRRRSRARRRRRRGRWPARYWEARRDFAFVGPTGTADECIDAAPSPPPTARSSSATPATTRPRAAPVTSRTCCGRLLADEDLARRPRHRPPPGHHRPGGRRPLRRRGRGRRRSRSRSAARSARATAHRADPYDLAGEVRRSAPGRRGAAATSRRCGLRWGDRDPDRAAASRSTASPTSATWTRGRTTWSSSRSAIWSPSCTRWRPDWLLALTPGGVDQDLLRLGHRRVVRPLYPFDDPMPEPDLTPVLL